MREQFVFAAVWDGGRRVLRYEVGPPASWWERLLYRWWWPTQQHLLCGVLEWLGCVDYWEMPWSTAVDLMRDQAIPRPDDDGWVGGCPMSAGRPIRIVEEGWESGDGSMAV